MTQKLIIIRGNSGSGKSTIAKRLQQEMGRGTMLIPQDVVRREILKTLDEPNNPSIELIYELAMHGHRIGYDVIVEGILPMDKYGEMPKRLVYDFEGLKKVYYLEVTFEKTLRRHATKPNAHEFGEKELKEWWKDKDYLGTDGEVVLSGDRSEDEILQVIVPRIASDNHCSQRGLAK